MKTKIENVGERERVAYHEAAHAVVAEALKPGSVADVYISGDGGKSRDSVKAAYDCALVDVAGAAAERVLAVKSESVTFLGDRRDYWGSESDNRRARSYIAKLGFSQEGRDRERRKLDGECERIVHQVWPAIAAVAAALLERGQLSGDDVRAIIRGGKPQPHAAQRQQATAESMSQTELHELRALAEARGQERLVRALDQSLGDAPPKSEKWTFGAEIRVTGEG